VSVLDADNGMGHLSAARAMRRAIADAKRAGVGAVGVRNSTHLGAAGTYPLLAADAECIGQIQTNGPVVMPPTGATEPRVSTNPVGTAIPSGREFPLVLDVSMAVAAGGKISIAQLEGRQIPEGWALDIDGTPTRDPIAARQGMLLPIADHKGYGMALVSDVLSGVLTGSLFGPDVGSQGVAALGMKLDGGRSDTVGVGHFCLALDIAHFMDVSLFKKRVDVLIEQMHTAKRRSGVDRILVPGELEAETTVERQRNGIPLTEPILGAIVKASASVGVPTPSGLAGR
jgi:LDH2 family malate/lactate/ureidoglycolate dehydrogenase